VVHHQSEDYNLSVALRQGWLQKVFSFAFYLPLAIIGFDTLLFVTVSSLVTLYQFWIHTKAIHKMGWLEYIFNTPSHHRVHHGVNPKYIDKNHGGTFIIWDRMFGTFQEEEEEPIYGITKPLNSWNPLWANLQHFVEIAFLLRQVPHWKDKLKVLFMPPGWRPEYLGGQLSVPEVDRTSYRKYDTQVPHLLNYYVFFQYLFTVAGAAAFLFSAAKLPVPEQAGSALLIVLAIVNCGALFELKKWVYIAEYIRLACTILFIALLFQYHILALSLISIFLLASIIWLIKLRYIFYQPVTTPTREVA
jgi:hypothetical protein